MSLFQSVGLTTEQSILFSEATIYHAGSFLDSWFSNIHPSHYHSFQVCYAVGFCISLVTKPGTKFKVGLNEILRVNILKCLKQKGSIGNWFPRQIFLPKESWDQTQSSHMLVPALDFRCFHVSHHHTWLQVPHKPVSGFIARCDGWWGVRSSAAEQDLYRGSGKSYVSHLFNCARQLLWYTGIKDIPDVTSKDHRS